MALGEDTDDLLVQGCSHWNLAEVLRMASRKDEAAVEYRRAMDVHARKGNLVMVERCRGALAELAE